MSREHKTGKKKIKTFNMRQNKTISSIFFQIYSFSDINLLNSYLKLALS